MDKRLIIDILMCILALICLISSGICYYFVYFYLGKFEKKHGVEIKGRGIFFIDRALCTGVLIRLAMRGPNKPIPSEYLENQQGLQNKYAAHYINIPYKDIKIFKLQIYAAVTGIVSVILIVLISEFLK